MQTAVQEKSPRRPHVPRPPQFTQPLLENNRLVEDLDDVEPPTVVELALDDALAVDVRVIGRRLLLAEEVVQEEHLAVGPERGANDVPERNEPVLGHVREPEPEEDEIVASLRPPPEQIGLDIFDARRP